MTTLAVAGTLPWSLALFGGEALDLLALPVAAVAACFGLAPGLIAVLPSLAAMALLAFVAGDPAGMPVRVPYVVLLVGLAVGFGGMRIALDAAQAQTLQVRRSESTLSTVLEGSPVVVGAIGRNGRFSVREGRALAALGFRSGEHVAEDARVFWRREYPEAPELAGYLDRTLAGEEVCAVARLRGRVFDVTFTPTRERGAVTGAIFVAVDVTERDAAERSRARSEVRLNAIVASALDAIITVDSVGRVILFNAAAERMFGYPASAMVGSTLDRLLPARARAAHARDVRSYVAAPEGAHELGPGRQLAARRADGSEFPVEITLSRTTVDDETLSTVIVRDVSEKRQREEQLRRLALYDPLTDLPNRTLFEDRLEQVAAASKRDPSSFSVLVADLDNFTDTNVVIGHESGDAVLRDVAARFRGAVRDVDTVARIGGDEFAVLVPGATTEAAIDVARRMLEALRRPLSVGERSVDLSASIGIAIAPGHATEGGALVSRAEVAMYRAKRERRTFRVYASDGHDAPVDVTLVADLRRAIEAGELELAYQPVLCLRSGRLESIEGLVRWTHPSLGPLSASRTVQLAERSGLIGALTRRVLEIGLAQLASWRADGHAVTMALNLSARDLADPATPALVSRLLSQHGVDPAHLLLEITETVLLADTTQVRRRIRALRDLGVAVAIDDFGTGYSSLSYLSALPVSTVKIDRSFVRRMISDPASLSVINAAISLAHELGLTVIAEGVERPAQLERLAQLGCNAAQGYYIGRPLAASAVPAWLRSDMLPSVPAVAPHAAARPA